ncbi:MAG TPA: hypothetical protein VN864_06480 [Thermoplasmata archaeon]|nr:hypothetical protein [Thermoplasmata archaeon]
MSADEFIGVPAPVDAPSTPPPRGPRRSLQYAAVGGAVAAVVVVVLVLGFVGVLPLGLHSSGSTASVTVRSATLSFAPSANPCFPSEYGGGHSHTLTAGGLLEFTINLTDESGGSVHACTVTGVNVSTPGFQLVSTNAPLLLPNGGGAELNISVQVPSAAFVGNLSMTANVTFLRPNIDVTAQNVTFSPSSDMGACGVDTPTALGFTTFAGSHYDDSAGFFVISPTVSCTITGVSTTTAGFGIVSSSTPYGLPIDNFGGVTFVLSVPSQAYTGNVTILLALSE